MDTSASNPASGQPLVVVNFSHPLDAAQLNQLASLTGRQVAHVLDAPAAIHPERPLAPQAEALVEAVPLSALDWQTQPILVNLPGLASLAAAVLAELHGRMGHFPAILRLRPEPGAAVTTYVVAEVTNLQDLRNEARTRRAPSSTGAATNDPPAPR